MYIGLIAVI